MNTQLYTVIERYESAIERLKRADSIRTWTTWTKLIIYLSLQVERSETKHMSSGQASHSALLPVTQESVIDSLSLAMIIIILHTHLSDEEVLAVLNIRDEVQKALKGQKSIPNSRLKKLIDLDAELRKNALKITQAVNSKTPEQLAFWRESVQPDRKSVV